MSRKRSTFQRAAGLAVLCAGSVLAAGNSDSLWTDIPSVSVPKSVLDTHAPKTARTLSLDLEGLEAVLRSAPKEAERTATRTLLTVPMPDGGTADFLVYETAVMHPDLAARYPSIHTYAGSSTSDPTANGRFDIGPRGFHGMILSAHGTVYIDPASRGDTRNYRSYFRRELPGRQLAPDRVIPRSGTAAAASNGLAATTVGISRAGELRTYRLALAADGEYSRFQDPPQGLGDQPDKAIVLAELVNVTNRVTGVYEREIGIRLQLIPNEDAIIFTNPLLDPYVDKQGSASLTLNTTVINLAVGSANYDLGHVVSTGGGGIAGLGVACGAGVKGQGVTGLPEPVGDGFYIDFVAHEMGHELGANHPFNSETGNCGGGNRNGPTAYEPGSGSTIMAYAGICGADDLQPHSDDIFHGVSFDEITAYTTTATGSSCGAVTQTGNHAPVVTVAAGGFTIPRQTPFELTGSATDADNDALTYLWDEFDLGAAGSPDAPDATAPLFRTFTPTTSPLRVFPQRSDLFNNVHTIGEILPANTRALNFRLTARDNHVAPSAGGVASAAITFNVTDAAGPFIVTAPASNASLRGLDTIPVTWNVAGTTAAPISCATVDIASTTDTGQTWTPLLAGTPNDGSETVTVPNVDTAALRIRVKCSNNIFFNLAPATLTVAAVTPPPPPPAPASTGESAARVGGGGMGWPVTLVLAVFAGWRRRNARNALD